MPGALPSARPPPTPTWRCWATSRCCEKIAADESRAVAPAAESRRHKRAFSMLRLLSRTVVAAMALVLIVEAVLAVLYWLYPNQVVECWRAYYNPYEKAEVVTSEKPPDASVPLDKSQLVPSVRSPFKPNAEFACE